MTPFKRHFLAFAHYNRWANARLYAAAATLTDAQYRQDCGAFFKSVSGTLNHLLATDRIWMRRFTGSGAAPDRVDVILHEDLPGLQTARVAEDERIIAWIDGLDPAALLNTIAYSRVSTPERIVQPLASGLTHFFNHQTHHRGQAHAILTGLTGQGPELDFLFFERQQSAVV